MKKTKLMLWKVYYSNTAGYEDIFTIHPTLVNLGDV